MPSVSKKQHNFMAAVANNPAFAKKAGVPQSVGEEFTKADKGKKFGSGGQETRADRQVVNQPKTDHGQMALFKRGGSMKESKAMVKKEVSFMKAKGAPKSMVKHEEAEMKGMKKGGNTSRMNRLEELGRVDSEKAYTSKGKKNLAAEKKRIVGGLKKMATGGLAAGHKDADGVASKGKTKAMQVSMPGNKGMKKGGMAKKYC